MRHKLNIYYFQYGYYGVVWLGSDGKFYNLGGGAPKFTKVNTDFSFNKSSSPTTIKNISALSINSVSSKTYTGKTIKPSITVKDGDKTLTKDTDYTITCKNNKNIGTATVIITGKGRYTGTKTVKFKILPPAATLKANIASGKIALSWQKVSGITKYQIQYSTDGGKTYKSAGKVDASKMSATLKLDTSKSYTFRIRSYKTVDGKKYYREPLKTQFERKRAIHAVYCVKPPNRAPARLRRLSLYPTRLSHFLFSKRFLEVPLNAGKS